MCEAEHPDPAADGVCLPFDGHPGPHSYEKAGMAAITGLGRSFPQL